MRSALTALWLLCACQPTDRARLKISGSGLSIDVVARSTKDQAHALQFEISLDPPADLEIACIAADERHRRTLSDVRRRTWTLYGLLADTEHRCTLTATTDGRTLSGELDVFTGVASADLPGLIVERTAVESWGAYTLFNAWETGNGGSGQQLIVVDAKGRVRWSMDLDDEQAVGVEAHHIGGRTLGIGGGKLPPQAVSLGGVQTWSFPELGGDRYWHHESAPTTRGTVLGLMAVPNRSGNRTWEGFRIEERTPDGELVSAFDSQDAFDAGLLPDLPGDEDPWHANALQWVDDPAGPYISLSLPRVDRILAIDPDSSAVRWQLGRGLDFSLNDTWFSGQHDPEWLDGRVLLHDNGIATGQSRLVELAVDPEAQTAEVLWEWTEPGWFEPLWGDADRLPDGTVLLTRGHCGFCPTSGQGRSQIAVVDPETGDVPWRLTLDDPNRGIYRAERIDGCALFDNETACAGVR